MPDFPKNIFKAYDIRGVYPDQLNKQVAYRTARAFATLIQRENPGKELQIVVSRDMRPSSPELRDEIVKGLVDSGVEVIDIGLQSTPTFYFAVGYYDYDAGIQITASHNPAEYNGLKMVRSKGRPVGAGTGMEELCEMAAVQDFNDGSQKGKVTKKDGVLTDEVKQVLNSIEADKIKPFKVVIDAANSVGALDMKALFDKLPAKLVPLYFELDGTFPNHEADPLKPENLADVKEKVVEEKADLGLALDGDGDRMFFIDEKGQEIPQPFIRGLMAQIALKDEPGAAVCYDIRPGRVTKDMIEEAGGKSSVTRVGHSLIKAQMLEENAVFGGESSGHYFYRFEYGTYEAPMILIGKFLEYVSQQDKPVSEIAAPYNRYFHSGEINSVVDDKEAVMEQLVETYSDAQISKLDGVTITYDDFWFNVRPSNTEPKLRLNLEAISQQKMEEKRDEVLGIIRG
ncbi:MAG: phosphomannomutase/phosphoglucomutase [Candidatus Pacebacteria bacterium]|nr:phosphomannomutase/phosphoglucomutase [Candidatus Paceibacterota bacterium]